MADVAGHKDPTEGVGHTHLSTLRTKLTCFVKSPMGGEGHTQESEEPERIRATSPVERVGVGHSQYVGSDVTSVSPILPAGAVGHLHTRDD